jgi:hypothetical protein
LGVAGAANTWVGVTNAPLKIAGDNRDKTSDSFLVRLSKGFIDFFLLTHIKLIINLKLRYVKAFQTFSKVASLGKYGNLI